MKKLTTDEFKTRLTEREINFTLVDEYIDARTKVTFECHRGHRWTATPSNILLGSGCPSCSSKSIKSKKIVNDLLISENRGIIMIDEYVNIDHSSLFECSFGHQWKTKPAHILNGGGCPSCTNFGFKPDKSAVVYLLDFGYYIKFGITNDLERRLVEHKRNGTYNIIATKEYELGIDALVWERRIKKKFGGKYVGRDICPDGWTETLPLEKLHEIESLL